jgi:hypothetical protein
MFVPRRRILQHQCFLDSMMRGRDVRVLTQLRCHENPVGAGWQRPMIEVKSTGVEATSGTFAQETEPSRSRYLLISNLYNEEENVEGLFDTVEAQVHRPGLWLIVDDGSTDRTFQALTERSLRTTLPVRIWRGPRKESPDYDTIGAAIRNALLSLEPAEYRGFDYYCHLDADSRVFPEYFRDLLDRMDRDSTLGMASGTVWFGGSMERTRRDLARGTGRATKAVVWLSVERERLPDFVSDAFFNAKTAMMGYRSTVFGDLKIRQTRRTGVPTLRRKGELMAIHRYNPLLVIGHALKALWRGQSPIPMILAYSRGLKGRRMNDPEVAKYFQRRMVLKALRWFLVPDS